ncbi:uncharacterized protein LOC143919139 [Arctopsyche grandis]|uniref:uncharacterized protein LOC143919139 n=1 Tax=Arctopsyche grandis TaxID=121162 RepID=UPI00406D7F02
MECRLCLCLLSDDNSVSIFDSPERDLLKQQIWSCCQLHVEKDDRLPNTICILCKYKIESFNTFRNVCIRSDETLKFRSTNCLKIKTEEVILDDLVWRDECVVNSPTDCPESSADYKVTKVEVSALDECDSNRNTDFIEIESTDQSLQMHGKNSYLCEISPKVPRRKIQKNTHDDNKPYQCDFCFKSFTREVFLFAHTKKTHTKNLPIDKFSDEKTMATTSENPITSLKGEILQHMPRGIPLAKNTQRTVYRRCKMCYKSERRKSTKIMCVTCEVALCEDPCFYEYHKNMN